MDVKQNVDVLCEYVDELKDSRTGKTKHWENYLKSCFNDWWLLELLCLFAGLIFMSGLCILLWFYDGQQVPRFGESVGAAITLNTIIAIFSLVIQGCLLFPIVECLSQLKWLYLVSEKRRLRDFQVFDTASRGAFGSFMLICKLGGKTFASLGGILIITAVTLTPIFQQLVSVGPHQVALALADSYSYVPVLTSYSADDHSDAFISIADPGFNGESTALGSSMSLPSGFSASIQLGFYAQNGSILPLTPSCMSGNCTFSSYQTLAICGHLNNVSESVQTQNFSSTKLISSVFVNPNLNASIIYAPDQATGFFMNITSVPAAQWMPFTGRGSIFANAVILASTLPSNKLNGMSAGPHGAPLSNFAPIAFEVSFEWCVQNYTTTVTNGIASTKLGQSSSDFKDAQGAQELAATLFMNDTRLNYTYGWHTQEALALQFNQIFNGSFEDGDGDLYASSGYAQAIWESLNSTDGSHQDGTNLKRIVDNIATSMTNYIRGPSASPYQNGTGQQIAGIAYTETTLVSIRWKWISGPAVFAVLTIVFVSLTITFSNMKGQRIQNWKSSTLASMAAPDVELFETLGDLVKPAQLTAIADDIHIQLVAIPGGHRWTLVQK